MRPALVLLLLVACGTTRTTQSSLDERTERYYQRVAADAGAVHRAFDERLALHVAGKADGTFDILALSGGGALGAFGAGFLQGWSDRPREFDLVTGVSTGALIAPFAFQGTDEAIGRIVELYRNPKKKWVVLRIFGALFARKSFIDPSGLHDEIRKEVTPAMLSAIADGSKNHRTLIAGATDLDLGNLRNWNLTSLAAEGKEKQFEEVLLASSAIPGAFPPVEIDGHLYADGGISSQFVFGVDPAWVRASLADWKRRRPGAKLPTFRLWIIINNKIGVSATTVDPSWRGVLERSLKITVRKATVFQLHSAIRHVRAFEQELGVKLEVRFVSIPENHPELETSARIFQEEPMRALVDLGRKMGADPTSWQDAIGNPEWPTRAR